MNWLLLVIWFVVFALAIREVGIRLDQTSPLDTDKNPWEGK